MQKIVAFIILLSLSTSPVRSQALPDLKDQRSWGPSEKKQFIQFLESGKQIPVSGSVKYISTEPEVRSSHHKARYVTVNMVGNALYVKGEDNLTHVVSSNLGAKILVGGHVFSWVRHYIGLQYNALDATKRDGQRARLNHYEFPIGLELALIPLGTPQTRYVILRGGASAHYISGNAANADFDNSLLGLRGSWNIGLGYEWQIADSSWRFHALIEGMRSMSKEKGSEFIGAGLTTGMVYTF